MMGADDLELSEILEKDAEMLLHQIWELYQLKIFYESECLEENSKLGVTLEIMRECITEMFNTLVSKYDYVLRMIAIYSFYLAYGLGFEGDCW
jgi:hypothetical protein